MKRKKWEVNDGEKGKGKGKRLDKERKAKRRGGPLSPVSPVYESLLLAIYIVNIHISATSACTAVLQLHLQCTRQVLV